MKAYLLHPDADLDQEAQLPPNADDLAQDLGLETLWGAMAAGDPFLYGVARRVVLVGLRDPDAIRYRQRILADCLAQPAVVRELYGIAMAAIDGEKHVWGGFLNRQPDTLLRRSVEVLALFHGELSRLRGVADAHAADLHSDGFTRFFRMVAEELDDAYLQGMQEHLQRLRFDDGVPMSAELGAGNRGAHYVLRRPLRVKRGWRERIGLPDRKGYVFQVPDRDEAGAEALGELRGRGIGLAATALAQSTDHILDFFKQLRTELAFYVGGLNLHERLTAKGEPTCLPEPVLEPRDTLSAQGLYDACLSLSMTERAVGNDLAADGKRLLMITGANRGGKSTFLRSLGLAQLMMQCGMFVPAAAFRADTRDGLFSHFKREEDVNLRSGKLDEELRRMSDLVDRLTPGGLMLLNESFASTNEREGSEIARQIVRALLESGVKVAYVTHLFDLADGFYQQASPTALFLRAERGEGAQRPFRLVPAEPLPTSFGQDVYRRVFEAGDAPSAAAST